MQTVEQAGEGEDLQLLLNWSPDPAEQLRLRVAVAGTIVIHLLLAGGLGIMPTQSSKRLEIPDRQLLVTKIFDPPTELTQKAPNKGKISKEIAVQLPTPPVPVPIPDPGAHSRKFAPPPTPKTTKQPAAAPTMVEPPKVETAQVQPQINLPNLPPQTQPERPPSETKPKLAFENPAPPPTGPTGPSRIAMPGGTISDAIRDLSRGANRGTSGSDIELGNGAGLNVPPSPGRPRMDFEMKTDPQGVDFRPYILQVLAIVRRNWFTVYPESAKLGTRGQVKLEFAVAKDGRVTKVAFSNQSGTQTLDRAAVAAISMSNPLPTLPSDYHGDRIVLAFTFSYNLGR
ncbi:MAG TPA: TonB family protein [Bryobacteraceae bacterium]|jgi:TonB family protein